MNTGTLAKLLKGLGLGSVLEDVYIKFIILFFFEENEHQKALYLV